MDNSGTYLDIVCALAGITLVCLVLSDVFQSIIVPHYRPQGIRLSPLLISKILWRPLRRMVLILPKNKRVEADLNMFAPAAMMTLLLLWLLLMTMGYSLILWAERTSIQPPLQDLQAALYFAATSVLTIGYGDVLATSYLARITVICAALCGLVLLAITVSFLFAVQSHFHQREVTAQIISSRHGHSANGAMLYKHLMTEHNASSSLELCERWVTEIYQSHSAYPLLLYFRSRSARASWLVQLGIVLDAAAIAIAMEEQKHSSLISSIYENGCRAVDVFSTYLTISNRSKEALQNPEVFEPLFTALSSDTKRTAARFALLRQRYFPALYSLADFFLIELPPVSIIDSSKLSVENPVSQLYTKVQSSVPAAPGMTATFEKPSI